MLKKLTITIDEAVYDGLYTTIGPRKISRFIEELLRPHVLQPDLDAAYAQMAMDEEREAQALEWADAFVGELPFLEKNPLEEGFIAYDVSDGRLVEEDITEDDVTEARVIEARVVAEKITEGSSDETW